MELKLAIRSPSALVLADRELAGVKPRSIVTTYFDTRRRALRSAGFGLRLRCDDGVWSQAVKSLAGVERYEHTSKLPSSELDVALLSDTPVAALIGDGDGLIPVFTTRVERRSRTRRHAGGRAEISLDRGELIAAGRSRSILELELELKSGAPGALFERAESLCRKSDFVLDFQSKAECGFGLADATLGEPAHFERPRFAPDATAGAAFRTLARACLRQLALNEALIGDPRRPDALHQARVALRRLRVAIALFKPMLALEAVSSVRAELAWLNGELADARNLDVYLAETFGPAAGDGPVSTPAQALWSRLVEARDRAWRRPLRW